MTVQRWEWVPFVRVGALDFGTHIDDYREAWQFERSDLLERPECLSEEEWLIRYESRLFNVAVETDPRGTIRTVTPENSVTYRGMELIGMPEENLVELIGGESSKDDHPADVDGVPHYLLSFHGLGAFFWMRAGTVKWATLCSDRTDAL